MDYREVLGLSEKANKASAVNKVSSPYCLVEETVEVLGIEDDVMAWAASNTDSLVNSVRRGS